MSDFTRRRFMGSSACVGLTLTLGACGGGSSQGSGTVITPGPTPTPAASPSPTPVVTPKPAGPITIAFGGSSSTEQYLSLYDGPADSPAVTASSDGINFETLKKGAFGKIAGTLINRTLGRDVRFIRGGMSSTTLVQWEAAGSPRRAALVQSILAAGGADVVLLQVGRNDAALRIIKSADAQAAMLRSLMAKIRAEAAIPNAMIFIGGSQGMVGGDVEQHIQIARQRLAEVAVVDSDTRCRYGFSTYDLETYDNIHQSQGAQIISGTRFAAQVIAWIQGTQEKRGPKVTGVTFVSQTQTDIELRLSGATDISPVMGIDGFQVVPDGYTELRMISAERRGPTTVRLTHESRGIQAVRVGYALEHDISSVNCLRDNSANALPGEPYVSSLM